jgi:hypothetical protein
MHMRKLALRLDELTLQTFETTLSGTRGGGTVAGHQEDTAEPCATQIYTCAACETYVEPCSDDGPDGGRRIIVYQSS